jgi:hypothetical protein
MNAVKETEPLFDVTLVTRTRRVALQLPRTAAEVNDLRRKGHEVIATPRKGSPPANEWAPNPYSQALRAVTDLYRHAEQAADADLQERAVNATRALLGGEAPSSVRLAVAPLSSRTLPGVGR